MIHVHYWPTLNGWKVTIMLDECGLPYKCSRNILESEQLKPAFLKIAPNNRIHEIVHHARADGGQAVSISTACSTSSSEIPS
jgi:GSH-dependent disulfide-bond oxidoreductase